MLRVIEINDIDSLSEIQNNWNALWKKTREASFFQTFAWLKIYWRHFSDSQKLKVLVVLEEQEMVGILPLVIKEESTRLGAVRVLTYPLDDWGSSFGPISEKPGLTLEACLKYLKKTDKPWDMLDLRWLSVDDLEENRTQQSMTSAGFSVFPSIWQETTIVDLEQDYSSYLKSRSPKFRSEIRRKTRRLQEQGEVQFIRHRPQVTTSKEVDPRWDLFEEMHEIAMLSWQGSSCTGTTISHPKVSSFFRESHVKASQLGMVDLAILRIDGRPAAFTYNYHHQGRLFGLRRGNLPEFHRQGIGTVMTSMLIEDSFKRGDHLIDMGPGSLHAKKAWLTRIVPVGRMTHYKLFHPRVQLLRMKHWWQSNFEEKMTGNQAEPSMV